MPLVDKVKLADKQNITITVINKEKVSTVYKISESTGQTAKYISDKEIGK